MGRGCQRYKDRVFLILSCFCMFPTALRFYKSSMHLCDAALILDCCGEL